MYFQQPGLNKTLCNPKRSRWLFLLGIILFNNGIAQDILHIQQLARDGAPQLAIDRLEQVQPKRQDNPEGWLFFERQRLNILRQQQLWQPLLVRIAELPDDLPPAFQHAVRLDTINAKLQLGHAAAARHKLREIIWQYRAPNYTEELPLYRRLLIRSYLLDDRLEDAQRAMQRYQQDYAQASREWLSLQARVLLRSDRAAEAERLLHTISEPTPELLALTLLAQLRNQSRLPMSILGDARAKIQQQNIQPVDQARFSQIAALAAQHIEGHLTLTRVTEDALLLASALPIEDRLFKISSDDLWETYINYGITEGNTLQLLVGQDAQWLHEAARWAEQKPAKARAMYTTVMITSDSADHRRQAAQAFVTSVLNIANGIRLLRALFLNSERYAKPNTIPDSARYPLIDDALLHNDIALATELLRDLETAPSGTDRVEWELRRARVLILGGDYATAQPILNTLSQQELTVAQLDRLVQVLFDLQTAQQHTLAISLFNTLLNKPLDPQRHREYLFWQADSYQSLGDAAQAAALYLRSAALSNPADRWGQTARFRAAVALTEADFIADARRLYQGLLTQTSDPRQRALLRSKLQSLWEPED